MMLIIRIPGHRVIRNDIVADWWFFPTLQCPINDRINGVNIPQVRHNS